MKSPLPKVLHPVAGQPMIRRVVSAAQQAGAAEVRVVVGFGEALVRQTVEPIGAVCKKQKNQWGTADAVRSAEPDDLEGDVLILNGDHPLLDAKEIAAIMEEFRQSGKELSVVTSVLKEPGSYGRIVRQQGEIRAIVEAKDASHETLKINEVNTGIYVVRADVLQEFLPMIKNENAQSEYYLTDIISICLEQGQKVGTVERGSHVAFGVNNQIQLAEATKRVFRRKCDQLMEEGVIIIDPDTTYIEDEVQVGPGTVIYPGNYLIGKTQIGSFVVMEPNCMINTCHVGDSVRIKAGSYLEASVVKNRAEVGPYAHLRPQSEVGEEAKVGNFVELKKTKLGDRSKASHLTYLGDADIGTDTNIGCGTITCNYAVDRKKYVTKIGSGVFVGSDSQFVAPVEIGDGAVIGSGSTITKDVPAQALAVARGRQHIKENYNKKPVAEKSQSSSDAKESK